MRLKHRRIYFSVMACLFLILAPALIGYGIGWRYNPASRQLEKVSALSVTSTPREAFVYVDNLLQEKQTPFSINNLHASDYEIRLEKDGYFPWAKKIHTYADRVTRMPHAYLVKQNTFDTSLVTTQVQSMMVSPSGSHILVINNTTMSLYLADGTAQWDYTLPKQLATVSWSAGETQLLLTFADTMIPPIIIPTLSGNVIEIPSLAGVVVREYSWSRNTDSILYARAERQWYEIQTIDLTLHELTEPPLEKYDSTTLRIFRESETAVWKTVDERIVATLPIPIDHTMRIEAYSNALFVLDTTTQSLYAVDMQTRQSKPLAQHVIALHWGSQRQELLYATPNELWLYNPQTVTENLVIRTSQSITQAQFMIADQYIGYVADGRDLTLFEISDLPRNTYTLETKNTTGLVTLPNHMTTLLSTDSQVFRLVFE